MSAVEMETRSVPDTMSAWRVERLGSPSEAMAFGDAPVPEPGRGQVLVQVAAAALNFPDVLMVAGQYQVRPPLPFTPGVEMSGRVIAVGEGVDPARVGRRVLGVTDVPAGGLAEYALSPSAGVFDAPEGLDDAEAASLHIAYQTGWFGLHRRARLLEGETLLVHAASGGVGSAAVQLGRAAGARVIAVVGGAEKASVARDLGADIVVDRTVDDIVGAVKDATGGRGADVIYDPVGGPAFEASTKAVAFEGRIVVVGFASGVIPSAPLAHALVKNYSLLGLHWGLYQSKAPELVIEAHQRLTEMVAAGTVRPLVSQRLTLGEAAGGLDELAAGRTTGRVVVEVSGA
jgi:NADPH2:quinone reductase